MMAQHAQAQPFVTAAVTAANPTAAGAGPAAAAAAANVDAQAGGPQAQATGQPVVPLQTNQPYYSIDVECVATGNEHNARAVAQISLIDQMERVILNLYVKPVLPVVSYLTPLTGLSKEMLEQHGMPLETALAYLRQYLPRNAVLVGQNIRADVQWLGLQENADFASMVDLAGLFRVWNPQYNSFSVFGQDHLAKTLLGIDRGTSNHDAVTDAVISMRLFNLFLRVQQDQNALADVQRRALSVAPDSSFAKRNPTFEGVCMGNRRTCTCGAPFFY